MKDHGVDPALINEVRDLSREFFTLPQAEKDGYAMVPGTGRGYAAMGVNVTQGKADWHEGVDLFREIPDDHRLLSPARPRSPAAETILRGKNPIVIRPAELGAVVDRYVDQMLETSWAVMRMMSVGLGLPERALVDGFCTEPYWVTPIPSSSLTTSRFLSGTICGACSISVKSQWPLSTCLRVLINIALRRWPFALSAGSASSLLRGTRTSGDAHDCVPAH